MRAGPGPARAPFERDSGPSARNGRLEGDWPLKDSESEKHGEGALLPRNPAQRGVDHLSRKAHPSTDTTSPRKQPALGPPQF